MTDLELIELAEEEGFSAAVIGVSDVPVDGKFRAFCEENLCGQYNANYSCPLDCGSVEELHRTLLAEEKVLVLQTIHDIGSYENKPGVNRAKASHNGAVLRLMNKIQKSGYRGFALGITVARCAIPVSARRIFPVHIRTSGSAVCPLTAWM